MRALRLLLMVRCSALRGWSFSDLPDLEAAEGWPSHYIEVVHKMLVCVCVFLNFFLEELFNFHFMTLLDNNHLTVSHSKSNN